MGLPLLAAYSTGLTRAGLSHTYPPSMKSQTFLNLGTNVQVLQKTSKEHTTVIERESLTVIVTAWRCSCLDSQCHLTTSLSPLSPFMAPYCLHDQVQAPRPDLQGPCFPVCPQLYLWHHLPTPRTTLSNPSFTPGTLESNLHMSLKMVSKIS